jgi:hypothetical protein
MEYLRNLSRSGVVCNVARYVTYLMYLMAKYETKILDFFGQVRSMDCASV